MAGGALPTDAASKHAPAQATSKQIDSGLYEVLSMFSKHNKGIVSMNSHCMSLQLNHISRDLTAAAIASRSWSTGCMRDNRP